MKARNHLLINLDWVGVNLGSNYLVLVIYCNVNLKEHIGKVSGKTSSRTSSKVIFRVSKALTSTLLLASYGRFSPHFSFAGLI